MSKGFYQERLQKFLQREISQIMLEEMADPFFHNVTVVDVEVRKDEDLAKIFVHFHGDVSTRKKIMQRLQNARHKIRKLLGDRLPTRNLPFLTFRYDNSLEKGARIDELLQQIQREKDEHNT